MKKTIKLFGFAVMVAAMVFGMAAGFTACEEGPMGAAGVDGKDGTNGTDGQQGIKGDEGPVGPVDVYTVTFVRGHGRADVTQTVLAGGWAVEPPTPTVNLAAGLYKGSITTTSLTFTDWHKDGSSYDFDAPVTGDITLTAQWLEPGLPTPVAGVAANNIKAAVDHVNWPPENVGTYTLVIDTDVTAGRQVLGDDDLNLTIIGVGGERTITYTGAANENLFLLLEGMPSLTLGNNITLKGRVQGDSTGELVRVQKGTLTMKAGSKITGFTATNTSEAVIVMGADATFIMEGGEISGNKTTSASATASGGVTVIVGTFEMSGGTIRGNTNAFSANNNPADVVLESRGTFKLSGAAKIGALTLYLLSPTYPSVTLPSQFTGSVAVVNLWLYDYSTMDQMISADWVDRPLVTAGAGYTLTAADIGRFTLGRFIRTMSGTPETRPIRGNNLTTNPTWANYTLSQAGNLGVLKAE